MNTTDTDTLIDFISRQMDGDQAPPAGTAVNLGSGPVALTLRVQRNGVDVPDGYPVRFSTTRGTLSASRVTTVGGRASVSLSASDAGLAVVTATGDEPPQSTATLTLNFRNVDVFAFSAPPAGALAEVGVPLTLTVSWQRNGAAVPNGSTVRFTTTRGSLSSAVATASGGSASVTLTGSTLGDADITAVGDLPGAPTASLRVSVRDTGISVLGFAAPGVDATVHELNASVPVSVTVRRNGVAVADGTVVRFTTDGGTLSATSASTLGGVASVSLVGTATGAATVTASADVFATTVTDRRTLVFRVAPGPLQVLLPAYIYPGAADPSWSTIYNSVRAKDALQFNVILKQADTLFATANADHLAAAQRVRAEGGRVLAHLPTGAASGTPSAAQIKAAADAYLAQYGAAIGGFFLDNMAVTAASRDFYLDIYLHIKGKNSALQVIGNTRGLPNVEAYTGVTDALVAFEGPASNYQAALASQNQPSWTYLYTNTVFSVLAQDVASCTAMQSLVQQLRTPKANAGLVYITNDTAGTTGTANPYDSLPSYWELFVATLDAINRGRSLPVCGP